MARNFLLMVQVDLNVDHLDGTPFTRYFEARDNYRRADVTDTFMVFHRCVLPWSFSLMLDFYNMEMAFKSCQTHRCDTYDCSGVGVERMTGYFSRLKLEVVLLRLLYGV